MQCINQYGINTIIIACHTFRYIISVIHNIYVNKTGMPYFPQNSMDCSMFMFYKHNTFRQKPYFHIFKSISNVLLHSCHLAWDNLPRNRFKLICCKLKLERLFSRIIQIIN